MSMRRRGLMAGVRLPSQYQEVEWIEQSSVNARFILPINLRALGDFEIKVKSEPIVGTPYILGNKYPAIIQREKNNRTCLYYNGGYILTPSLAQSIKEITVSYENNKITLTDEGGSVFVENVPITKITSSNIYVFSPRIVGNRTARIYYVRISSNDADVVHLIPCYRVSDSEVGMYDIVNDIFYTNQDTGSFIAGPEV